MNVSSFCNSRIIYEGKGVPAGSGVKDSAVHSLFHYLLGRDSRIESGSLTSEWMQAIFFRENSESLKKARQAFREILQECKRFLSPANAGEEKLLEAFVGNLVAILPYMYPLEREEFEIPVKVDNGWKMVNYTVDQKIKLTPGWFSKPLVAYGLISPDGPPILSFLGTTFPTGEGFMSSLLVDFTPTMSIGHSAYLLGKKALLAWMKNKQNIQLYGVSLGGALTFHVLRNHQEKIGKVFAYNPAGLYFWDWKKIKYHTGPDIQIYYQQNDLVAKLGRFPSGKKVSLYRVSLKNPENFLKAHMRIYSGGDWVKIEEENVLSENRKLGRQLLAMAHFFTSFLIFSLLLASYLFFVLMQKIGACLEHIF